MFNDYLCSPKELRRRFSYHEKGWLIRKVKTAHNTYVGQIVKGHRRSSSGSVPTPYKFLKIGKRKISFHRAVWAVVYGKYPRKILDHIDGNAQNNRIENLREASLRQNNFNSRLHSRNKTGHRGVFWLAKRKRWSVVLKVNGKYKTFGRFKTKGPAIKAQQAALEKYHKEFQRNFRR